jgi:hypothetical protein
MAKGAIVEALQILTVNIRFNIWTVCQRYSPGGKKNNISWTAKMIKGREDAEAGWRLRINKVSLPISITS